MSTRIDNIIFGNIDRTRENIGRHIANQTLLHIWIFTHLCSVNRIIRSKMEIIRVISDRITLRDVSIVLVFGRSDNIYLPKQLSFLDSVRSPCAGIQIRGFLIQQIVRNHTELHAGATAHEYNLIACRNIQ